MIRTSAPGVRPSSDTDASTWMTSDPRRTDRFVRLIASANPAITNGIASLAIEPTRVSLRGLPVQRLEQCGLERLQGKGLQDDGHLPFAGPLHHGRVSQRGEDDDGHGRGTSPDGLDDIPAGHLGHNKVRKHEIPAALVETNQSTPAIGRGLAVKTEGREEGAHDLTHVRIVVDHEYPRLGHRESECLCKLCQLPRRSSGSPLWRPMALQARLRRRISGRSSAPEVNASPRGAWKSVTKIVTRRLYSRTFADRATSGATQGTTLNLGCLTLYEVALSAAPSPEWR